LSHAAGAEGSSIGRSIAAAVFDASKEEASVGWPSGHRWLGYLRVELPLFAGADERGNSKFMAGCQALVTGWSQLCQDPGSQQVCPYLAMTHLPQRRCFCCGLAWPYLTAGLPWQTVSPQIL
jgi:hypothetical protein